MTRSALLGLSASLLLLAACATPGDSAPTSALTEGAAPPPVFAAARPPAPSAAPAQPLIADFDQCVARLRDRAAASGVPQPVVQQAFAAVQPNPRVVELDRRQPEFLQTFWHYLDARLSPTRIERGRTMLAQYQPVLREVEARYGVAPRYLVAFWGLESNYGENMGGFPVVESLATLACEGRRADFFEGELMNALRIAAAGDAPVQQLQGSWAGAMGQPQFMPSTFLRYAVDADRDGRRDIWYSVPDVFASAANFLREIGWQPGGDWGQEVILPPDFDYALASLSVERPVSEWRQLGVRSADGRPLAAADEASVVVPAGHRGPAFLVYPNFRAILNWNRSINYALAVGLLADRLAGGGPLVAQRPADDQPLRRDEVVEIQTRLAALGEDAGEPDGIVGPKTRAAIRGFQSRIGAPADGYPDQTLLWRLRSAMGS